MEMYYLAYILFVPLIEGKARQSNLNNPHVPQGGAMFAYTPEMTVPELGAYARTTLGGVNLEDNPLVEPLLQNDVTDGPCIYAQAFEHAAQTSARPERKATYLLQAVRGHLDRDDIDIANEACMRLLKKVRALTLRVHDLCQWKCIRKYYFKYAADLYGRIGAYREAAYAKRMYAARLMSEGKKHLALLYEMDARLVHTYGAIAHNCRLRDKQQQLACLRADSDRLESIGGENLRMWQKCNLPLHRLLTHHLAGIAYERSNADACIVAGFADDARWARLFGAWSPIARAVLNIWKMRIGEALEALRSVCASSNDGDIQAMSYLLISYAYELKGRTERSHACKALHSILEIPATNYLIASLREIAKRRIEKRP